MSTSLGTGETETFSIDPDSDFAANVDIINHSNSDSLEQAIRTAITHYNETAGEYPISTKNVAEKATTVHEVLARSRAVVIETSPGLVKSTCGEEDPEFDRFEPFVVAFPEYTSERQMLFRGMAALSEVYHQMITRNRYREGDLTPDDDADRTAEEAAQRAEQAAFTRYPLDSFYDSGDHEHDGEYFDKNVVDAIHVCKKPIRDCLLVGSNSDGLYAGRGNFSEGDVMVGLDRLVTDDRYENQKLEVFSEYEHRSAFSALSLPETGALYNQHFYGRWEADLDCLDTLIDDLASHEDVGLVSVHPITEAAYRREHDRGFGSDIVGYDA